MYANWTCSFASDEAGVARGKRAVSGAGIERARFEEGIPANRPARRAPLTVPETRAAG